MSGKYTELFLPLEKQNATVMATQSDFVRQDVLDYAAGENIIVLYCILSLPQPPQFMANTAIRVHGEYS